MKKIGDREEERLWAFQQNCTFQTRQQQHYFLQKKVNLLSIIQNVNKSCDCSSLRGGFALAATFFFNALKKDIPVKLLLSFFVKEKQLLFLVKQYSRLQAYYYRQSIPEPLSSLTQKKMNTHFHVPMSFVLNSVLKKIIVLQKRLL